MRSPEPNLALAALAAAVVAAPVSLAALLMLATAVTTVLLGGPWAMPMPQQWPSGVAGVVTHPGRPGDGLGQPWSDVLAGHGFWYWTVTTLLAVSAAMLVGTAAVTLWGRFGLAQAGHASREDIREELSLAAARRTAAWTRPSLSAKERSRAPLGEVAAPLHLTPFREPMCTPLENPTGTLAPTQSGKSRKDLAHKAIAAPGALLCSTTKPDLLEFSALLRSARPNAGPVVVADLTGAVTWPAPLRWSPIEGCADPTIAFRRAHTMVEAASVGLASVTGNDKVFRDRAKVVLQAYFMAAALHRRTVEDLVRWAVAKPVDQEPVRLLQQSGHPEYARNLRSEIGMVAETSDAVWMSVRRVLEPFLDPKIRHFCTPPEGARFEVRDFIAQKGSLYLIAGKHQAAQAAPVLTALAEQWLTTARDMAPHTPHRRLDPPATAVFDELTGATPIPQLPDIVADSAGVGVLIHWAAQSIAALENTYDPQRMRQLLDNTTTLTVWGGIKDRYTLEWVSMLTDHYERRRYQHQDDGLFGTGRTSVGIETAPTYRPGAVRKVPRNRVLVIHRHLAPILARTVDIKQHPAWTQIRRHITVIRDDDIPIGHDGRATATAAPQDRRL